MRIGDIGEEGQSDRFTIVDVNKWEDVQENKV